MLTRYGKLFLPYVEESLKVLEEGVQRTRELNGSKEGIIHLAYIYTMGSNFTPKWCGTFWMLTRIIISTFILRWERLEIF